MTEQIKPCYGSEIQKTADELNRFGNCFRFAVVTDTHLDNSLPQTLTNIREVDSRVGFDCLLHLGDFLNGSLSRSYTKQLLNVQMELFKDCIASNHFYPVEGNHDGFGDRVTLHAVDITPDEDWYEATKFVDSYENVGRAPGKPYFYVDYPIRKIRLIVLCTFFYTGYDGKEQFKKLDGTVSLQAEWLKNTALDVEKDWTVMIFSHDTPFVYFDERVCENNRQINGNLLMDIVKQAKNEKGFDFAAWFVGHYHGDYIGKVNGLNFIVIASETAYIPQLWDMPDGGCYPKRQLGTDTEDLWDGAVLDKDNRKVRLFRFGAGKNREIDY